MTKIEVDGLDGGGFLVTFCLTLPHALKDEEMRKIEAVNVDLVTNRHHATLQADGWTRTPKEDYPGGSLWGDLWHNVWFGQPVRCGEFLATYLARSIRAEEVDLDFIRMVQARCGTGNLIGMDPALALRWVSDRRRKRANRAAWEVAGQPGIWTLLRCRSEAGLRYPGHTPRTILRDVLSYTPGLTESKEETERYSVRCYSLSGRQSYLVTATDDPMSAAVRHAGGFLRAGTHIVEVTQPQDRQWWVEVYVATDPDTFRGFVISARLL